MIGQTREQEAKFYLECLGEWAKTVNVMAGAHKLYNVGIAFGMTHSWMLTYIGEFPDVQDKIVGWQDYFQALAEEEIHKLGGGPSLGTSPVLPD